MKLKNADGTELFDSQMDTLHSHQGEQRQVSLYSVQSFYCHFFKKAK